jgi:hypothetical protein
MILVLVVLLYIVYVRNFLAFSGNSVWVLCAAASQGIRLQAPFLSEMINRRLTP